MESNFNLFAGLSCRHYGTTLVFGCETKSGAFCRCFVLNKTPFLPSSDDIEYSELLNRIGCCA